MPATLETLSTGAVKEAPLIVPARFNPIVWSHFSEH
jgi:hypothetical protein